MSCTLNSTAAMDIINKKNIQLDVSNTNNDVPASLKKLNDEIHQSLRKQFNQLFICDNLLFETEQQEDKKGLQVREALIKGLDTKIAQKVSSLFNKKLEDEIKNFLETQTREHKPIILENEQLKIIGCQEGGASLTSKQAAKIVIFLTYLFVINVFAGILYAAYLGLELDKIQCFSWYAPFVTLFRTDFQNMYCRMLTGMNSKVAGLVNMIKDAKTPEAMFKAAVTVAAGGAVTYKSCLKIVRLFDKQVAKIVVFLIIGLLNLNIGEDNFEGYLQQAPKKQVRSVPELEDEEDDEEQGDDEGDEAQGGGNHIHKVYYKGYYYRVHQNKKKKHYIKTKHEGEVSLSRVTKWAEKDKKNKNKKSKDKTQQRKVKKST